MEARPEMYEKDSEPRRAGKRVVLACDQHDCTVKGCEHDHHRKDLHFSASMLEMLGLAYRREKGRDADDTET